LIQVSEMELVNLHSSTASRARPGGLILQLMVAAACTSGVGASAPTLAEALLEDMLPASSSKCVGGGTTAFTFNHTSSQTTSKWDEVAVMFERSVFLAEMSHTEVNANRSWTLRVGKAGNMYSFVGPFGESVPPQYHPGTLEPPPPQLTGIRTFH
jgi:hypothetical protein